MAKTKAHQKYKLHNGTIVPSVTTIINESLGWNKNALVAWARREALAGNDPNKLRDKAADIGTLAHYLIESHLKGIEPDVSEYAPADLEKARNCFNAYLKWESNHVQDVLHTEISLVSQRYGYGGTIDLIAVIDGKLSLVDFKSSNAVYPEHKIQVVAYAELYKERFGSYPKLIHLLQLNKDGSGFEHHCLGSMREMIIYWLIFEKCLGIYKLKRMIA